MQRYRLMPPIPQQFGGMNSMRPIKMIDSPVPLTASAMSGIVSDTIAAVATPVGRGGIGIVRISGNMAKTVATRLFRPAVLRDIRGGHFDLTPHHLHYGHIIDPASGKIADEVLIAYMPGPHSYTREDVVEVQSHAGAAVLGKILALVLESGARLAEPGEFTRRAFVNGRIDLSQAEAVADLICAESENAAVLASDQLSGGIKRQITTFINEIDDICAAMEACIEFPEEAEEIAEREKVQSDISNKVLLPVKMLIDSYGEGRILRDGLRIAIAGRPNVGKSSLLNRLIETDKAIVAELPGTTRDPVEAGILFKGVSMRFSDTAGIHPSQDPVETIGIRKSREIIEEADLVLLTIDAQEYLHSGNQEIQKLCAHKKTLIVVNKIDLINNASSLTLWSAARHLPTAFVSATEGAGIGELKEQILNVSRSAPTRSGTHRIISNIRHKKCLEAALENLERGLNALSYGYSFELVAMDLRGASDALREITGERIKGDLLDRVFEKFCIGK
jgi:tRNA modification GTPase